MNIPSEAPWTAAPSSTRLEPGTVHLWRASREGRNPSDWLALLCPEEKTRAERLRFALHRERFIVFRGILRTILGKYLDLPPAQVRFEYEPGGKPLLANAPAGFAFNLSHSHDWMVLACGHGRGLGVDIEKMDPRLQAGAIARRWFTVAEQEQMRALIGPEQLEVFFQIWTQREAVLKAEGVGLARLQSVPELAPSWQMLPFVPAEGYAGCLAIPKDGRVTGLFDFGE